LKVGPPPTELEKITSQIRGMLSHKKTRFWYVEIGNLLLRAKEIKGRGDFDQYVEQEIGISRRSAYRYIAMAEDDRAKSCQES
jgi:hypothetical protein